MLCFRDMTFCGSDCTNEACFRHFGLKEATAAAAWMENPPVAFSDFSKDCPDYMPISESETGEE